MINWIELLASRKCDAGGSVLREAWCIRGGKSATLQSISKHLKTLEGSNIKCTFDAQMNGFYEEATSMTELWQLPPANPAKSSSWADLQLRPYVVANWLSLHHCLHFSSIFTTYFFRMHFECTPNNALALFGMHMECTCIFWNALGTHFGNAFGIQKI